MASHKFINTHVIAIYTIIITIFIHLQKIIYKLIKDNYIGDDTLAILRAVLIDKVKPHL